MGFLLRIILSVALLVGGMYYFFHDTPFYRQLIPGQVSAAPTDTLYQIYITQLKLALKERKPTDRSILERYYRQAAQQKYQAMIAGSEQILTFDRYLEIKKREFERYVKAKYDRNGSGTLEREEWPEVDRIRLIAIDRDRDNIVTLDEFWREESPDSAAQFKSADDNGDNQLTEAEYLNAFASDSLVKAAAAAADANNNGAVDDNELSRLSYLAGQRWIP